jgi:putative exporter of polyketide antibiotics
MNYDQYMNLVRAAMNMAGGMAVTAGLMSGSSAAALIGLVPNVAAIAWGLFVHSPAQVVKAADDIKAKGLA